MGSPRRKEEAQTIRGEGERRQEGRRERERPVFAQLTMFPSRFPSLLGWSLSIRRELHSRYVHSSPEVPPPPSQFHERHSVFKTFLGTRMRYLARSCSGGKPPPPSLSDGGEGLRPEKGTRESTAERDPADPSQERE